MTDDNLWRGIAAANHGQPFDRLDEVDSEILDAEPTDPEEVLLAGLRDVIAHLPDGPCRFGPAPESGAEADRPCEVHGLPPLRITDGEIRCAVRHAQLLIAAGPSTPGPTPPLSEEPPDPLDEASGNRHLVGVGNQKVNIGLIPTGPIDPARAFNLAAFLVVTAEVADLTSDHPLDFTFEQLLHRVRNT